MKVTFFFHRLKILMKFNCYIINNTNLNVAVPITGVPPSHCFSIVCKIYTYFICLEPRKPVSDEKVQKWKKLKKPPHWTTCYSSKLQPEVSVKL